MVSSKLYYCNITTSTVHRDLAQRVAMPSPASAVGAGSAVMSEERGGLECSNDSTCT